jgi:hypothetical protein
VWILGLALSSVGCSDGGNDDGGGAGLIGQAPMPTAMQPVAMPPASMQPVAMPPAAMPPTATDGAAGSDGAMGGDPAMMDPIMMDPSMMDPSMMDPPMMDPPMTDDVVADGTCCADGDCLCHGDPPSSLTSEDGPFNYDSYTVPEGCVYYPTDAEPPFAAVSISDGFVGTGGCGLAQTGLWGPLYASWGIVAMVINTGGGDQPPTRGQKLGGGIEAFKRENGSSSSPLYEKLSGRYGTSGFSMGGGGTTYASESDPSLLSSVAIMPWGPTRGSVTVPTLVICGASDGIASCGSHGTPFYGRMSDSVSKMRVTVSGGHNGQPTAGGGDSGEWGLAFTKVFLEGDERWRSLLVGGDATETNIQ